MANRRPTFNGSGTICVHGAREHNLKNLSLEIPRNRFVVITGVSGSGKSTLAFDLLFAEGQRRFLDSMNTYARQFVEQLARPDVDLISGLPPTVSIEQRTTRGGGKSTVATVTEIYHFLRLLFARLGRQYCPNCELPVQSQTRDEVGRQLRSELKERGDLLLLAPVVRNRKGFHSDVAEWAARHGYREVRADGKIYSTAEPFRLDRFREHDIEIVIGVLESRRRRKTQNPQALIDQALKVGHGTIFALDNRSKLTVHSTERACPKCSRSFQPLDPKMFSYNSAQGWCPKCRGFGELFYLPDVERGARADAIEESWFGWQEGNREICPDCEGTRINPIARAVRLHLPVGRWARLLSFGRRGKYGGAMSPSRPTASNGRSFDPTIQFFGDLAVEDAYDLCDRIHFKGREAVIARDILPEIRERLKFLREVGLGYLQLGRGVTTLSGGEAQRIRLAAQLGSNLSGVLYVLDEPTIGLHARDNEQLLAALHSLQARGNSLVVVEHDEETMRRADYIVDLGPGAGVHGGELVAAGTLRDLLKHQDSITGQCLRQKKSFPARGKRRPVKPAKGAAASQASALVLRDAAQNNLKDLTVEFPLNRFVVVTGVSGSGKSTLVRECLLPAVQTVLQRKRPAAADLAKISGWQGFQAVYEVDQSPIGRTPRSTPATYVGFFDEIRKLFAQVPEARLRGYSGSRFSFNSQQGRCPGCEGAGTIKLEMNFLPPAFVRCETCGGCRFNRETLDIEYRGKNIAQVLELSVDEAIEFFSSFPKITRGLEALRDTGLGYLKLGQTSPTLSGGEAQRLKLVTHLLSGLKPQLELPLEAKNGSRSSRSKRNLFILEEPTIGLHSSDVRRLVEVLQRLIDHGHSVIVIEHNLDLIAEADWVIDLGPEGGEG
ncbi:MAG TPA: excinuclease ABC subunit A, partial [Verrucomicrobiae bacterium]|nr:excinuclease ABC subunit A [Verrucomicrobiae bacterium]